MVCRDIISGMAPPDCYSVMVILLCVVIFIHPLMVAAHSKCEDSFECGNISSLEFPMFRKLGCGMFPVVECTAPSPILELGETKFEIHSMISKNKFSVKDTYIDQMLLHKDLPEMLCYSFWLSPHLNYYKNAGVSFSITSSITLASCPNLLSSPQTKGEYHSRNFKNFSYCDDIELFYYSYSTHDVPLLMPECYHVYLPMNSIPMKGENLIEWLTPEFDVELNVSAECSSCHHRGGDCVADASNHFLCQGLDKESKRKDTIILASAISGSSVILALSFVGTFLIYRCNKNKKKNGSYLLSKSTALGPSKSDLELGGGFNFGIPIFSYQELEEATEGFDLSKELGDGGFGTVYYGKLHDGREVAIKRLYEHNGRRVEQFLNEIKILTCLRHPNLVSLYGCTSRRSRELLLVYEYIPNGTVADHLHGAVAHTSPLTWPIRMRIAIETASALAYLHSSDIIHRDVKTNNILLDMNFNVKVADFGISRLFPNDVSHISTAPQGTPGYVDPEYHQCYQLTNKSDVYSFGVVLIELVSSLPAVDLTRHRQEINLANLALDRIQRCAFDELIDSSLGYQTDPEVARMTNSVAELAFRCLQLEKDLRPSMDEVLAFLKDIQAGDDWSSNYTESSDGKYSVPGRINFSETNGEVLVKGNIQSSPVAVTQ